MITAAFAMRNLTATIYLTLVLLLGSAGVSWSADLQKGLTAYDSGDYTAAFRELKPLADQGVTDAQFNLGVMYYAGQGIKKNLNKAIQLWTLAGTNGHASAQINLGSVYLNGTGVNQDYYMAMSWYRRAAYQGDYYAEYSLGEMYIAGWGVPPSAKEAFKWWMRAAKKGYAPAELRVGSSYDVGIGVLKNEKEAVRWYRLAAERGNADAQLNLGAMYDSGAGIPRSKETAIKWYRLAAKQGNADAQFNLGVNLREKYRATNKNNEFIVWLKRAAYQGHSDANFNLGELCHRGDLVPQDFDCAVSRYRRSIETKNPRALHNLGILYVEGNGVPKNLVYAHAYLSLAVLIYLKDSNAQKIFLDKMSRVEIEETLDSLDAKESQEKKDEFGNSYTSIINLKIIEKYMTPADISAAQKLARECVAKNYKGC